LQERAYLVFRTELIYNSKAVLVEFPSLVYKKGLLPALELGSLFSKRVERSIGGINAANKRFSII
jgi:hypothetical protein